LRQLLGLTALAAGVLVGLYGFFLIAYEGDTAGGEETYVSFGGSEIDADIFGGIAVVVAVLAIGVGLAVVRGRFARRS
jgi:hypothetical protein